MFKEGAATEGEGEVGGEKCGCCAEADGKVSVKEAKPVPEILEIR